MEGDAGVLPDSILDLAVVGGGVAGTFVASSIRKARPAWSIALFERSTRFGGRLHSIHPPGLTESIDECIHSRLIGQIAHPSKLERPDVRELLRSVEPWPATKLYLWYEQTWWRDGGFRGRRVITDLGIRKIYYLDDQST